MFLLGQVLVNNSRSKAVSFEREKNEKEWWMMGRLCDDVFWLVTMNGGRSHNRGWALMWDGNVRMSLDISDNCCVGGPPHPTIVVHSEDTVPSWVHHWQSRVDLNCGATVHWGSGLVHRNFANPKTYPVKSYNIQYSTFLVSNKQLLNNAKSILG